MLSDSCAFTIFTSLFYAIPCLSAYQRSPILGKATDIKHRYFPCVPVEVRDNAHDIVYVGRRCPTQLGLEVYSNIRYASSSPLSKSGLSTYSYPAGNHIDTSFPYAFCPQMPSLPYNLTYEHMRDIEDRAGSDGPGRPIPEECLSISVYRPADLPDDMSVLISPAALNSTHKRGLLPVTLIINEGGPGDEGYLDEDPGEEHDQLDDDFTTPETESSGEASPKRKANAGLGRGRLDINAASIVARDMDVRGTGRVIVVANFVNIDKLRGAQIFKTIKAALEFMKMTGETKTADTCRTKEEFRRLSRMARKSNQESANPIEWPVYGSARGRNHADILLKWIAEHIEAFGGEPTWVQEVVILPDGAMWRTTTEREWQAKRIVREEDLKGDAVKGPEQNMVFNMPI